MYTVAILKNVAALADFHVASKVFEFINIF